MSISIIGKQIAMMRKEKGVKQEELARFVGVSTQAVSKWENGGVPDIELLPKIADFFCISIDFLFGRNITDYSDLQSALVKKVHETSPEQQFKQVLNYCWNMERAMIPETKYVEKEIPSNEQHYSAVTTDHGFTRMGIANRLQYFLIVPEPADTELAYFNGIDYPKFFKDFSDRDFFNTCVLLNKRDQGKGFTPMLLVKHLGITLERANEILLRLMKYRMVYFTEVEVDDEIQTVYNFMPTPSPSFMALLIFARELIDKPTEFAYSCYNRSKPYLK